MISLLFISFFFVRIKERNKIDISFNQTEKDFHLFLFPNYFIPYLFHSYKPNMSWMYDLSFSIEYFLSSKCNS